MKPLELARISKALSVETRVRLLRLLKNQSLCVGALASRLGITPGAVSQHLRVLREAGLVVPRKRGYYMHYQVDQKAIDEWLASLAEVFGSGAEPEYKRQVFPLSLNREGDQNG